MHPSKLLSKLLLSVVPVLFTAVPAAAEAPVGPRGYTVTIVSATIAPRKPDGRAWDVGDGAPDVVAEVKVVGAGSGAVRTTRADNTTSPTWNQSGTVSINKGDRLAVLVVDKDAAADDEIDRLEVMFVAPGRQTLQGISATSIVFEVAELK